MIKNDREQKVILRLNCKQLMALQNDILKLASKSWYIPTIIENSILQSFNLSLPKTQGRVAMPNVNFRLVMSLRAVDATVAPVHIYQTVLNENRSKEQQEKDEAALCYYLTSTRKALNFSLYPSELTAAKKVM